MAVTASPPSDPIALARFLTEAGDARNVGIGELTLLPGGAIQQNWGFRARFIGGPFEGEHDLVLRTDAATGIPSSLGRIEEFAVLWAAFAAGVTVPEPLFACSDPAVIGKPFFVMRRVAGTAQGRRITADPVFAPGLPRLACRLGHELALIQTIRPPRADLGFLPQVEAAEHIASFRAYLDRHPNPRPVLEWAIRWLESHLPEPLPPVLCHRDFRTGNYLVDRPELTGILDWEFAGWGDPDEDIGWFCCKGWRFARLDREAGGIADRAPFYHGYQSASGRRLDPARVRFWEVLANVRWAVIALQQSDRHLIGGARDLATAIIGRRASECDLELLMLLDPDGRPGSRPCSGGRETRADDPVRDLPSGAALLALGRDLLLDEILPLLPPERHREVRLLATTMAIAERERLAGDAPAHDVLQRLSMLYRGDGGDKAESREHEELGPLLRRLAADLRNGAFESCEPRATAARAILWRLTILKLREGNPQFLAQNGFGD